MDFKSYPKQNHLFVEDVGKSKPSEYLTQGYVAAEVIDDIATWVKNR